MNFKQLEAFYWLTRLHSFHQVADHIGLTQPAVSARISGLEDEFGVKLIDRDAPSFRLTAPGMEVAEFAERFMNMHEAMIGRLKQKNRRRFAIAIVGPAGLTWGNLLRKRLSEVDPDQLIDITISSTNEIRDQVNAGAVDLAFATGEAGLELVPDSFAVRYSVGWAGRPDLVPQLGRPLTPRDLRAQPLILYPRTSPIYSPIADYIDESDTRPAPRHYGNAMSTICDMLRQGYGLSAVPLAVLETELAQGLLTEVPVSVPLAPFDVRCVHLTGARRKLAQNVFDLAQDCARQWCDAHPRYAQFIPA
ncbi:transcriptional regulator [Thioclava sp. SK-1]|uniref:LysR family transcriptional regulator n=1 Tax=Thioclava sp. SK-1 TaxID=1889770 RepID=UPI000824DF9D|nr:LysR family transcriptional regulator [Thioclava sp. SK-1]OCX67247.1 transcriptional regulator [Thioclava sp. SK-1]